MSTTWDDPAYTPLANLSGFIGENIRFRDWEFTVIDKHGVPYLCVSFSAVDSQSGNDTYHSGRKWPLSYHMTKGEIVQTALKAVLTALEHEAREQFLYRGRAVLGPHLDIDSLWEVASRTEMRGNPNE